MPSVRNVTLTVCALILLALGLRVKADTIDDSPEAVSLYAKGQRQLREGNFFDAVKTFAELEARFANSKNLDLFVYNRAKARYYLGNYSEASAAFSYFISRFTTSPILPYAHFFLGNSLYLNGEVNKGVKEYLRAYRLSEDPDLDKLLVSSLVSAFRHATTISLGAPDLEQLTEAKKCALAKPLADIYVEIGETKRASDLLALCGEKLSPGSEAGIERKNAAGPLDIAMVLPLSGDLRSFGQEIYNGAVIGAQMYRDESGKEVNLDTYDTQGDPIEAARIISELSKSVSTDAAIGPLTSEEAAVASATLACGTLPMVAPAATQAGLTSLSSTSFQMSPNIDLEAITLAEYAFNRLHADTAAVISSTSTDDIRMTRAFSDRFEALGGTVLAVEYYSVRDKDFGTYIRDIKGLILGATKDSTFYINADGDTLDVDVIPARIDCLFMPGNSRQLRQLIPQVNFYNLSGQYLGSDGWADDMIYRLGDDVTKQAVFASPFIEGENSEEYLKFSAAYDSRYGGQPQRLAALGYDAMRLVAQAAAAGGNGRDNIVARLRQISNYAGASGVISFGENRENIEMPLYRIETAKPVPLTESGAPSPEGN
jgi:branched-chain amino acid transport system substrate-binding protein